MKIDEATGLPELPEGYVWHIKEHEIRIEELRWTNWRSHSFSGLYDRPFKWETREVSSKVKKWWRFPKTVTTTEYRDQYGEPVRVKRYDERDSYGYTLEKPDPVTKDNLLERCEAVYTEWQEQIEREKLYGLYPPNKFEEK